MFFPLTKRYPAARESLDAEKEGAFKDGEIDATMLKTTSYCFNEIKTVLIICKRDSTPVDFLLFILFLLCFQYMLRVENGTQVRNLIPTCHTCFNSMAHKIEVLLQLLISKVDTKLLKATGCWEGGIRDMEGK